MKINRKNLMIIFVVSSLMLQGCGKKEENAAQSNAQTATTVAGAASNEVQPAVAPSSTLVDPNTISVVPDPGGAKPNSPNPETTAEDGPSANNMNEHSGKPTSGGGAPTSGKMSLDEQNKNRAQFSLFNQPAAGNSTGDVVPSVVRPENLSAPLIPQPLEPPKPEKPKRKKVGDRKDRWYPESGAKRPETGPAGKLLNGKAFFGAEKRTGEFYDLVEEKWIPANRAEEDE